MLPIYRHSHSQDHKCNGRRSRATQRITHFPYNGQCPDDPSSLKIPITSSRSYAFPIRRACYSQMGQMRLLQEGQRCRTPEVEPLGISHTRLVAEASQTASIAQIWMERDPISKPCHCRCLSKRHGTAHCTWEGTQPPDIVQYYQSHAVRNLDCGPN